MSTNDYKTVRSFEHDKEEFEIRRTETGERFEYEALASGKQIGGAATVSREIHGEATAAGVDLDTVVADVFEQAVKAVYDLKISRLR